jgi:elongation factor Ts
MGADDLSALLAADLGGKTVEQTVLTDKIATIGENMAVRRMAKLGGENVVSYVHNAAAPGMGKIGVLVAFTGGDEGFARQVAMHVAAVNPAALNDDEPRPRLSSKRKSTSRWTSPAKAASPKR